jgi:hypothetical protein
MPSVFRPDDTAGLTGPSWACYAPLSVAIPTRIADILEQVADAQGDYQTKTGWEVFGLAGDSQAVNLEHEEADIEYNNAGNLYKKVSTVTAGITVHVAGITSKNIQIVRNAPRIIAVTAGANMGAESQVPYGTFEEATLYRIALISRRPRKAREVTEPGGKLRGAFVADLLYAASITGDERTAEFDPEEGVNMECVFTGSPVSTQPVGEEYGRFMEESAGSITAV